MSLKRAELRTLSRAVELGFYPPPNLPIPTTRHAETNSNSAQTNKSGNGNLRLRLTCCWMTLQLSTHTHHAGSSPLFGCVCLHAVTHFIRLGLLPLMISPACHDCQFELFHLKTFAGCRKCFKMAGLLSYSGGWFVTGWFRDTDEPQHACFLDCGRRQGEQTQGKHANSTVENLEDRCKVNFALQSCRQARGGGEGTALRYIAC